LSSGITAMATTDGAARAEEDTARARPAADLSS
jgi:hypothetical protein